MPDETAIPQGLTSAEAAARRQIVGPNQIVAQGSVRGLLAHLEPLADPMALMLLAAAGVYLSLGETRDAVVLLAALVPVLGVDVLLEARSRAALRRLREALAPRARVRRDGREQDVASDAIVPGDVLVLVEGDVVHADGRVLRANNLAIDESSLTGEAEPQIKRPARADAGAEPGNAGDAFFAGSVVVHGDGLGEVTATGPRTQFGRVAALVAASESAPTPLQRRTGRVVRALGLVAALVAVAVFALALLRGRPVSAAILSAVSLAIAAVPEEFPLVFTLFLSLGAWRLGRRGVLVRRLVSVETLGSTTVLCVDKTGTLTTGHFGLDSHAPLAEGMTEIELLEASVLACEIRTVDPLERAIVDHGREHGVDVQRLHARWALRHDYPFDPAGKHMSHVWALRGAATTAGTWTVAKGALEGILEHCDIPEGDRRAAEEAHARMAGAGVRVLAVAGKRGGATGARAEDEGGWRLYGLLGFLDPLRPSVAAAVAECRDAGIALKLITGDHLLTARAVAEAAGLDVGPDGTLSGADLDALPAAQRADAIRRATVFARVRPEQKHEIVDTLVKGGEVVAMTGDGINDAPALRRADIGVAMGRRGTEAARAAADLVLLDDDLDAMVATVREGRRIFLNIQRAFLYLIAFHIPIVAVAVLAPVLGLPLLLLPIHLVWLELIVHPVSALVFEGEPAPADVMRRPPRAPGAPLLPKADVVRAVVTGAVVTGVVLGLFAAHLDRGVVVARSTALAALIVASLFIAYAERAGDRAWTSVPLPRTRRFWIVTALVALSLPAILHVAPLARALAVAPLAPGDWLAAVTLGAVGVLWRAGGSHRGGHRPGATSTPSPEAR